MSLNIKNDEVDRLARELAKRTGKSITTALEDALRAELNRLSTGRNARPPKSVSARLLAARDALERLPILDARSADEILGYGPDGLPR